MPMPGSFWEVSSAQEACDRLAGALSDRGMAASVLTGRGDPRVHVTREGTDRSVRVDPHRGSLSCDFRGGASGEAAGAREFPTVEEAVRAIEEWLAPERPPRFGFPPKTR